MPGLGGVSVGWRVVVGEGGERVQGAGERPAEGRRQS